MKNDGETKVIGDKAEPPVYHVIFTHVTLAARPFDLIIVVLMSFR